MANTENSFDFDIKFFKDNAENEILNLATQLDTVSKTDFWRIFVESLLDEITQTYDLLQQTTIADKDTEQKVRNDIFQTQYIRGLIDGMKKVLDTIKSIPVERDIILTERKVQKEAKRKEDSISSM